MMNMTVFSCAFPFLFSKENWTVVLQEDLSKREEELQIVRAQLLEGAARHQSLLAVLAEREATLHSMEQIISEEHPILHSDDHTFVQSFATKDCNYLWKRKRRFKPRADHKGGRLCSATRRSDPRSKFRKKGC
jgi:hypothetical protein